MADKKDSYVVFLVKVDLFEWLFYNIPFLLIFVPSLRENKKK